MSGKLCNHNAMTILFGLTVGVELLHNQEFYLAVEDFVSDAEHDTKDTIVAGAMGANGLPLTTIVASALAVYRKFIHPGAPYQVNLSGHLIRLIEDELGPWLPKRRRYGGGHSVTQMRGHHRTGSKRLGSPKSTSSVRIRVSANTNFYGNSGTSLGLLASSSSSPLRPLPANYNGYMRNTNASNGSPRSNMNQNGSLPSSPPDRNRILTVATGLTPGWILSSSSPVIPFSSATGNDNDSFTHTRTTTPAATITTTTTPPTTSTSSNWTPPTPMMPSTIVTGGAPMSAIEEESRIDITASIATPRSILEDVNTPTNELTIGSNTQTAATNNGSIVVVAATTTATTLATTMATTGDEGVIINADVPTLRPASSGATNESVNSNGNNGNSNSVGIATIDPPTNLNTPVIVPVLLTVRATIFNDAQQAIFHLLVTDVFPRFLKSSLYSKFAEEHAVALALAPPSTFTGTSSIVTSSPPGLASTLSSSSSSSSHNSNLTIPKTSSITMSTTTPSSRVPSFGPWQTSHH
jgi:hypothetical protein